MQKLDPEKPLSQSVRKIAHKYLKRALELLEEQRGGLDESVHQARRNLKRVRALLKLVESADKNALRTIRKTLSDAAKTLSEFRDATALVECAKTLGDYLEARQAGEMAAPLLEALEKRRDLLALEEPNAATLTAPAIAACKKAAKDIEAVKLNKGKAGSILAEGRSKNHDKARASLELCHHGGDPDAFHNLRKCAQSTLFQAGLLKTAWPFAFEYETAQAKKITEILGHEHDIEVLNLLLHSEPHLFGAITDKDRLAELLIERRSALRHEAMKIAESLYGQSGQCEGERLAILWSLAEKN